MDQDQKDKQAAKIAETRKDLVIKQALFREIFEQNEHGKKVFLELKSTFGFSMAQVAEAQGDRQQQAIGNAEVIEYIEQIMRIDIPATETQDGN